MGFTDIIFEFLKGIGSAVSQAGVLKETLSSSIADGVEGGISRAIPLILNQIIIGSVFLTGIFLLGMGASKWVESLVLTPGVGFGITGIIFIASGLVYLHTRSS